MYQVMATRFSFDTVDNTNFISVIESEILPEMESVGQVYYSKHSFALTTSVMVIKISQMIG